MFYTSHGISIFIKKNFRRINPEKKTIFFLHGFGGSSGDWQDVFSLLGSDFQLIALDLPGFGKSSKPRSDDFYKVDFLVQLIDEILIKFTLHDVVLTGYSMGGRLALHCAINNPTRIKALILESASAGIKTLPEREARRKSDAELISFIEENSLNDFFSHWQNQPLFNSQKKLPLEERCAIFLKKVKHNSKIGLANSLKNFGQGSVENVWQKLPKITLPVLLLSGSLDSKYSSLQNEMAELLPNSTHKIIDDAGHNLHLEKPTDFVNLIRDFLQIF